MSLLLIAVASNGNEDVWEFCTKDIDVYKFLKSFLRVRIREKLIPSVIYRRLTLSLLCRDQECTSHFSSRRQLMHKCYWHHLSRHAATDVDAWITGILFVLHFFQPDWEPPYYLKDVCQFLINWLLRLWIRPGSLDDNQLRPWLPHSSVFMWFFMKLHQRSCVRAPYFTWFTRFARKNHKRIRYHWLLYVKVSVRRIWL